MIEIQNLQGSAKIDVQLGVSCSGMTIRVEAGTFRVAGVDYVLEEEQTVTLDASVGRLSVTGYLACDPGSTVPYLFVDEVPEVHGDFDHYDWPAEGPQPIHLLFIANVPKDTTDLADVPVKVFLRVPPKPSDEMKNGRS